MHSQLVCATFATWVCAKTNRKLLASFSFSEECLPVNGRLTVTAPGNCTAIKLTLYLRKAFDCKLFNYEIFFCSHFSSFFFSLAMRGQVLGAWAHWPLAIKWPTYWGWAARGEARVLAAESFVSRESLFHSLLCARFSCAFRFYLYFSHFMHFSSLNPFGTKPKPIISHARGGRGAAWPSKLAADLARCFIKNRKSAQMQALPLYVIKCVPVGQLFQKRRPWRFFWFFFWFFFVWCQICPEGQAPLVNLNILCASWAMFT